MLRDYPLLDTVVIGAGLVGMASAAANAFDQPEHGLLVLEKGPPTSYRANTPSQGNLRGSRVVDQTMELTADIRRTWQHIDLLESTYHIKIQGKSSLRKPYLMVVKDPEHLRGLEQDLADKGSRFKSYSLEAATRQFKINFPIGYAGVVNTLESKTLDIEAYLSCLKLELEANRGEVRYQTWVTRYGKVRDGSHLIVLSDGSQYSVKNLIVATGTEESGTLHELKEQHAQSFREDSTLFEPPLNVPKRFRHDSSILVPQRTIHVVFTGNAIHANPVTVYNLDIDRTVPLEDGKFERHPGNLGFYMFPETIVDRDGERTTGLKVGYDPMGRSLEDRQVLDFQEQLMLDHVSKSYGVSRDQIVVVRRHSCAYPLDSVHYPCMGQSAFHGIHIAANFIGYGAMAAYGAAERMRENSIEPDSRYNPDIEPNQTNVALFKAYYGDDKTFPFPPSAKLFYTTG